MSPTSKKETTSKKKKTKSTKPAKQQPEQKLGDTPVAPWEMPTPEEKQQAKPVRRALKKAVSKVNSQKKADQVIEKLESAVGEKKAADVEQAKAKIESPAKAAQKVKAVEQSAPESKQPEKVIAKTAEVVATSKGRAQEAVAEAVQEAMNPEQQGAAPTVEDARRREYLRTAVLKRLKPVDALDANIFLAINHLPHTRLLNGFFYSLTLAFQAVTPWFIEAGVAALRHRRHAKSILREVALPLLVTGGLVELVIKPFFKRRRPFITIIQAIVIGKKPGTWSFPSGHSAGAFAGAWLLNNKFPKFGLLRYFIASLVAFSRIYLGDHYPGDVASGSLSGLVFAMVFYRIFKRSKRKK
ncbi:MAG: phosphatase PAP2 family protein [Anaerolineales bacterium]